MKKKLLLIEVEELSRDAVIPPCAFSRVPGLSMSPIASKDAAGQICSDFLKGREVYHVVSVHAIEDVQGDLSQAIFGFAQEVKTEDNPVPWRKGRFIEYLEQTLIPDLRDSGRDATADDFETCIKFMS